MRPARIIALAKAVTAAEAAAQGFVDAETSELSQLDKRELEQLVALTSTQRGPTMTDKHENESHRERQARELREAKAFWGKPQKDEHGRIFYTATHVEADGSTTSWRIERLVKSELHSPGVSYVGSMYGYIVWEIRDGAKRAVGEYASDRIVTSLDSAKDSILRTLRHREAQRAARVKLDALIAEQHAQVAALGGLDQARTRLADLRVNETWEQEVYNQAATRLTAARLATYKLAAAVERVETGGAS